MSPALKEKGKEKKATPPRARASRTVKEGAKGQEPSTASAPTTETAWAVVWLPVAQIDPNPYQPRTTFDAVEMEELVASVKAYGVLQPVTVRTSKPEMQDAHGETSHAATSHAETSHAETDPTDKAHANGHQNGQAKGAQTAPLRYHLISGERRLRACREAGRKVIAAIVRDDLSDVAVAELALIENVQRSNLSVIEEAAAYKRLMLEFRLKEERLAKKVGKSVATIKDMIKLLQLPQPVQKMLSEKKLTPSHGQQLLRLAPFPEVCRLVANKAVSDHLTAVSLGQTPLPNVRELRDKNLLVELGHSTQFDWREVCAHCPHGAYVQSGYGSYCLNTNEWHQKQATAIELKKQEAARVMEVARQEGKTEVETEKLPPGSYRDLSHATVPSGCSAACPCRGEASDPRDATRKVPICLNPNRFSELVQAERQAHEQARHHRFTALWREARDTLQSQVREGEGNTLALLLIRPLLLGYGYGARHDYGGDFESWSLLVRQVVQELDIPVPWQTLCDPDAQAADVMAVLKEVPAADVLLLSGCLWLAIEANTAVRFGGETPDLDLVLGRSAGTQAELPDADPNEDGASAGAMVEAKDDADLATSDEPTPDEAEWNDPDADEGDEHEWVWNEAGSDTGDSASAETAVDHSDRDSDAAMAAVTTDESNTAN